MRRTLILPLLLVALGAGLTAVQLAMGETGPGAGQQLAATTTYRHLKSGMFAHSDECMACHNNLQAPDGEDVSIGTSWRASMMANSGRDPYWQAGVRRETIDHPMHGAEIQNECTGCHMPMAQRTAHTTGELGSLFAHLPLGQAGATAVDRLAADGVSCTVCHQISSETLGTRASFNGRFVMRPARPDGVREAFGPFSVDAGRRTVMRSATGFEQVEAPHIRESRLCASCHTLITQAIGPDGQVIGSLPEQMNFQEWEHSAYREQEVSCQSCHMPRTAGPVRVSSVLGDLRDGLARHVFVGGNAFMVRLLDRYRVELGVTALSAELEATAGAAERQLQTETAHLEVSTPQVSEGRIGFDVEVRVLTGHKFPTGYPSRRTWLHVTVRDALGGVVFESGGVDATGRIAGNANDADPLRYEPHYARITSADQVQIYEPIMGDPRNRPTTGLLTATHYLKDNRLLPEGFDKATADPEIGVYGAARDDADFGDGGDVVRYELPLPTGATGPFTVEVALCYQPIGYRWAHNLESYDAPEPQRFVRYYNAMAESATTIVARATAHTG
jgi:hypothetical protein